MYRMIFRIANSYEIKVNEYNFDASLIAGIALAKCKKLYL